MITDKKIVITGVTGKAVEPIARALATDNEVYGVARFRSDDDRERLSQFGIIPCAADLGAGDLSSVPQDPHYVLHFAWMRAGLDELERAMSVNVEGAGLLLQHCKATEAALVVSSMGIYSPHEDPRHAFKETDAIGRGATAYAATSPATKLGLEAVSRFCARAFDLPVTIARLNTVLGPLNAYHGILCRNILDGRETVLPGEPNLHSPIHSSDMIAQIEPLLAAARSPALIVNWCGDDTVSSQDALDHAAARLGKKAIYRVEEKDGIPKGNPADPTLRRSITGPCSVPFQTGFDAVIDSIKQQ